MNIMKICSINRLPKFNKLPELLFYKRKLDYVDCISVISTKTQKVEGIMECLPNKEIYSYNRKSVLISYLTTFTQGKGFGKALLNFAKTYSKEMGCEGNFHLVSSAAYTPFSAPHGFYRKFGMNSGDIVVDAKIDRMLKKKIPITYRELGNVVMYYPPVKYPEPKTLREKWLLKHYLHFT